MLERSLIRTEIRQIVRDRIISGELAAYALLSPPELAHQLGVSATPVREALIELVHDGLIDNVPNRGFVVRALTTDEVHELYPLMWTLEILAIQTTPPDSSRLDELARINKRFASARSPLARQVADAAWHECLVGGCSNRTLLALLARLRARVQRYEVAYMRDAPLSKRSVQQHEAIVRALRAGKVDSAAAALRANWAQGVDVLVGALQRTQP